MKSIASIKTTITRLNNQCNSQGISLFECLESLNISLEQFCFMIGLDFSLLNEVSLNELLVLLKSKDTRIFYSPGMSSLNNDEISIYSKKLHTNIGYLNDKVKVTWDNIKIKDNYQEYAMEFLGTKREDTILSTIHFSSQVIIDPEKSASKILSQKYPLEHVTLKIEATLKQPDGTVINEKSFQITINHDMIYNDLQNIHRILYNFNFPLAVTILKLYPTSMKIMSNEVEMNNFHNR